MNSKRRWSSNGARFTPIARLALVIAVMIQVAATVVLFDGARWGSHLHPVTRLFPLTVIPFVIAVAALSRSGLTARLQERAIVVVTVVLQVIAMTRPPLTSNDDLRYIWDGKVQLAGISPYRYVPNSPALVRLHTSALFTHHDCGLPTGCALLNRPNVHTVYPPVAQAAFDTVRILSFGGHGAYGGQQAFQVAAGIGVLLATVLMLRRARRTSSPIWWVALWAWCPVVVSEFGNNAHIDWVAVLFTLGAIAAYVAARPIWSGAFLGAAIATKLYPVMVLPALLRRHPLKLVSAAIGVVVLGYIPQVAAVGAGVIGYLPGYLSEEGYDSGSRLKLLGAVLPHPYDTYAGVLILAVLAIVCWSRTDPKRPEFGAVWLAGATFLVMSPDYGWYATLLLALIAITGRWQWLPVVLAPTCTYLYGTTPNQETLIFVAAAVLTFAALGATGVRNLRRRRATTSADARVSQPSAASLS
ncbi:glycosyltransferase family 87 protein [Rudaeicoccus suwonensis]|uniref:glycosyltransferase family 87 protein n=1 Tax=Rudaeicoccus suwonensis TaxID=657409 RepID=UPI001476A173|nr:glycosyltransferase family 87 protein [Rudaeicoccus suwonensis]